MSAVALSRKPRISDTRWGHGCGYGVVRCDSSSSQWLRLQLLPLSLLVMPLRLLGTDDTLINSHVYFDGDGHHSY